MDISDFKQVDVKKETSLKAIFSGKQFKRTMIYMTAGALISFAWFYYSEGQHMGEIVNEDILKSLSIGAFFGIFISNSPCARGKC